MLCSTPAVKSTLVFTGWRCKTKERAKQAQLSPGTYIHQIRSCIHWVEERFGLILHMYHYAATPPPAPMGGWRSPCLLAVTLWEHDYRLRPAKRTSTFCPKSPFRSKNPALDVCNVSPVSETCTHAAASGNIWRIDAENEGKVCRMRSDLVRSTTDQVRKLSPPF